MPYQVLMMGWVGSGEDFCGLGWVGLGPEILGWVGFWKSDPWPTLPGTDRYNIVIEATSMLFDCEFCFYVLPCEYNTVWFHCVAQRCDALRGSTAVEIRQRRRLIQLPAVSLSRNHLLSLNSMIWYWPKCGDTLFGRYIPRGRRKVMTACRQVYDLCLWHTYRNRRQNRYQFLTRLASNLVPNFSAISFW